MVQQLHADNFLEGQLEDGFGIRVLAPGHAAFLGAWGIAAHLDPKALPVELALLLHGGLPRPQACPSAPAR